MPNFSRTFEIHYENKLEKLLNEIKTAKTSGEKELAEEKFNDVLCEIATNYKDKRARRLVKKYDSKREDYKLEQEIRKREND
ncbi:MAG: hypothetical protein K6T16_02320 [Candidatus Pacearchaeota archaeon]|nr:hypothetical protein [Candidatus Pacearchaeota archaeon]